ncbi:hypothetical protein BKA64DRAFT_746204 [Cadophora sp. MPI-SDFR-AT-0126]|nr:hypothetical protein BKA64DRAFT_746204 [Leotiomycetes sp. MPI-SDFR-AT-0126]
MAAIVLDIKLGDEVIVPSYTYVSTTNAWLLREATLVYVDVDPTTTNINHELTESAITSKTRAIVAIHVSLRRPNDQSIDWISTLYVWICGVACEMESIVSLAKKHNLLVVEDAAQALTSTYKSRCLGSIGDIGCFSFHETKNFTAGGQGGARLFKMTAAPFHLTAIDRKTLSITDGELVPYTWTEVKVAIAKNDISTLPRSPSILRRYIDWSQEIMANYCSTAAFLLQYRLFWVDPESSQPLDSQIRPNNSEPLADRSDYKVIYNGWPYGLTVDIIHLVVWMKTPLAVDDKGGLTAESRVRVKEFVDRTFIQRMRIEGSPDDSVVYFRNIPKLQSVGTVEHFHILLRGAKKSLLEEWINATCRCT